MQQQGQIARVLFFAVLWTSILSGKSYAQQDPCRRVLAGVETRFEDNGTGMLWGFCVPTEKSQAAVRRRTPQFLREGEGTPYRFSCPPGAKAGTDCFYTSSGRYPYLAINEGELDVQLGRCMPQPSKPCSLEVTAPRWESPMCRAESQYQPQFPWNRYDLGQFTGAVRLTVDDHSGSFEYRSEGMGNPVGFCSPLTSIEQIDNPNLLSNGGGQSDLLSKNIEPSGIVLEQLPYGPNASVKSIGAMQSPLEPGSPGKATGSANEPRGKKDPREPVPGGGDPGSPPPALPTPPNCWTDNSSNSDISLPLIYRNLNKISPTVSNWIDSPQKIYNNKNYQVCVSLESFRLPFSGLYQCDRDSQGNLVARLHNRRWTAILGGLIGEFANWDEINAAEAIRNCAIKPKMSNLWSDQYQSWYINYSLAANPLQGWEQDGYATLYQQKVAAGLQQGARAAEWGFHAVMGYYQLFLPDPADIAMTAFELIDQDSWGVSDIAAAGVMIPSLARFMPSLPDHWFRFRRGKKGVEISVEGSELRRIEDNLNAAKVLRDPRIRASKILEAKLSRFDIDGADMAIYRSHLRGPGQSSLPIHYYPQPPCDGEVKSTAKGSFRLGAWVVCLAERLKSMPFSRVVTLQHEIEHARQFKYFEQIGIGKVSQRTSAGKIQLGLMELFAHKTSNDVSRLWGNDPELVEAVAAIGDIAPNVLASKAVAYMRKYYGEIINASTCLYPSGRKIRINSLTQEQEIGRKLLTNNIYVEELGGSDRYLSLMHDIGEAYIARTAVEYREAARREVAYFDSLLKALMGE